MKLVERFWAGVTYAAHMFTFSSVDEFNPQQKPIPSLHPVEHVSANPPSFTPPNGPEGSDNFTCEYPAMKQWKDCSTTDNRQCWLRHDNGTEFNISTNYEKLIPQGITRKYKLDVTNGTIAPDGFKMTEAKFFNGQYPGPWIKACWGDEIEVNVTNYLRYNGTAVHWHGLRQLNNTLMDGVGGVTQCPIAPNDSFVYKFKAMQYGSSWYHSHYSLQYGDGLLGPITIFGPSSDNYDEAKDPILLSDWGHRSAFQEFYQELGAPPFKGAPAPKSLPSTNSILLNGKGRYTCTANETEAGLCVEPPKLLTEKFEKGKRYLLRIINTSVDSTFAFAIDNHNLTVVGADFVPMHPYTNTSILVGIGQRYHVIVEANPIDFGHGLPADGNYWMRAFPSPQCSRFANPVDNRTGIVRYSNSDADPTSLNTTFSLKCSDETYSSLKPVLPWSVSQPVNPQALGSSIFEAGLTIPSTDTSVKLPHGGFARWSLGDHPLWLNLREPTVLHLNEQNVPWDPELVVVEQDPTGVSNDDWVYLVITATGVPFRSTLRNFVPAAHPIHLHGHDFAILAQSDTPYWAGISGLNLNNPPRRDVALLPSNGYIVIAFKTDNPGTWLLHCHIAWHASSGLALQILEREGTLNSTLNSNPQTLDETRRICKNWKTWHNDANNWSNPDEFQDDSGI